MAGKTLDINGLLNQAHDLAGSIADKFIQWNTDRGPWLKEQSELRNYIFATDTRTTTNAKLPWKNSTTIPKLTQIRDNLHANYMAALFPHDDWLTWEADDQDSSSEDKRNLIENYMKNKTRNSEFINTVSQMVYDYIDFGNTFGTAEYRDMTRSAEETGKEEIPGYVGPVAVRLSPYDLVFNPTAERFERAPKIVRALKSLGELKLEMEEHPNEGWLEDAFDKAIEDRQAMKNVDKSDHLKSEGMEMDGFGSITEYYNSDYIEVLTFIGDLYDIENKEFLRNHIISVVDRRYVIRKIPNPSWRPSLIRHVGWRQRPDNLYGMGPLNNLVGMQYRIDHLENLKADAFDLIAHPVIKVTGYVEDFEYGPEERIYVGDDGDVEFMRPDASVLQADTEIEILERKMEELAGAPKQAMGIRTPGEKTAFEVAQLQNAASRIFQEKINHFERQFLEPLLNDMLSVARENMATKEYVPVVDNELGARIFESITPEDLNAKGIIRPVGARHFAAKATRVQNLVQLAGSAIGQDPAVNVHISGFKMAKLIEEFLDLDSFDLVQQNVRVFEQQETESAIRGGQQQLSEEDEVAGTVDNIPLQEAVGNEAEAGLDQ